MIRVTIVDSSTQLPISALPVRITDDDGVSYVTIQTAANGGFDLPTGYGILSINPSADPATNPNYQQDQTVQSQPTGNVTIPLNPR